MLPLDPNLQNLNFLTTYPANRSKLESLFQSVFLSQAVQKDSKRTIERAAPLLDFPEHYSDFAKESPYFKEMLKGIRSYIAGDFFDGDSDDYSICFENLIYFSKYEMEELIKEVKKIETDAESEHRQLIAVDYILDELYG